MVTLALPGTDFSLTFNYKVDHSDYLIMQTVSSLTVGMFTQGLAKTGFP